MRWAFFGRVSDKDKQDPSISIPRQFDKCVQMLPVGDEFVRHYWDIESGRKYIEDRGHSADGSLYGVSVPRDGGVIELLADARRGLFDAVMVECIDRLSRKTADSTAVEKQLDLLDIGLFASDEPMTSDATALLTRRVKQGVAEWYVRDLLEKSRRGMVESVRQGWHTGGRPPYGYTLEAHPHPNPNKAREGKRKHRLILDPVRAPIILMIFEDYCLHSLGLGELCDKLNSDLDHYPPPQPNHKDDNGLRPTWSRSVVRSILRNPKYTGYNVWGRHDKRRGRPLIRPHGDWTWSATPTHEPIISKELFEMVEDRARGNEAKMKAGMARSHAPSNKHRPGRFYPLRGRVRCGLCGRSMEGSHQKGSNWYRCQYVTRRGSIAADIADHPRVLGVKEANVLDPVLDFLARRIFGPDRLRLLRAELSDSTTATWREQDAELERLKGELGDIDRSLHRQTLRLEEHEDSDHPVVALAIRRIEELSTRKRAVTEAIDALKVERPAGHHPDEILAMLDAVPDLRPSLRNATEQELADLLAAFDVTISYDKPNRRLTLTATIGPGLMPPPENDDDRPEGRSLMFGIAGAGFEPATFGL